MWYWLIIAGLFSGVIAGMGMGGGTLLIPVLTLFLGIEQKIAQSINLVVFIPTAIVALIIHFKNKLVNVKVGLIIIISGVVLSILGALLAVNLRNDVLKICFGIFLLAIGLFQFFESLYSVGSKTKLPKNVLVITKFNKYKINK